MHTAAALWNFHYLACHYWARHSSGALVPLVHTAALLIHSTVRLAQAAAVLLAQTASAVLLTRAATVLLARAACRWHHPLLSSQQHYSFGGWWFLAFVHEIVEENICCLLIAFIHETVEEGCHAICAVCRWHSLSLLLLLLGRQ